MMTNRREAICTLISTVLAGFGLPGGGHAGAENDAVRSIAYGLDGQRVGGEAAKWARDQVAVLNQLAIRFSGQELYSIAEVNLHLLRTLLQARAATGQDDSELRLAIAHTASLTGWFAEDAELFEQASQHYHFAVEMAHSAGGHDFAVFSLARLAATDLAKGQPAQCLAQLEATAAEAGQDSPWRSFIQMFAVEAYGKLGDISKAQRMLAKADVLYDGRDTGRLPEWAYWIPRPSSTSIAARSFIPHDPRFAAMLYEHALEQVPAEFVCDRIHLKVGLARAKQNLGDLDEALFRAGEVLQEVLSLREPRAEKMLIEFHANLPDDPVAKEFKERFTDYARMRKLGTLHS